MKRTLTGQLVMPRIDFGKKDYMDDPIRLVKEFNVPGFIVFNGEKYQVREAISELQSHAEEELFFGCDAERGLGQIVKGGTKFPFLMSQGAANDPELVRTQAAITASELKECGFNLIFAPVLDINNNSDNPIINIRAFGDDPAVIATLGTEFIRTVQESGVIACAKHFPGHGDCNIDSHVSLPLVTKSEEQLSSQDMMPFREAVNKGLYALMLAHVSYTVLDKDSIPATFSPYIINKILRNDIGFEGLVISDSFMMGALREFGTENEIALKTLKAGCNLILDPVDPFSLIEYLDKQYQRDEKFAIVVKEHSALLSDFKKRHMNGKQPSHVVSAEEPSYAIEQICERSVCRVRGGILKSDQAELIIVDIAEQGRTVADSFKTELLMNGVKIEKEQYINGSDDPARLARSTDFLPLIVLVYTSVRAWRQYSTVPQGLSSVLNELIKERERNALLSFGSPYIVKHFDNADIQLVTFDFLPRCQMAMARALTGITDIKGTLPVEL